MARRSNFAGVIALLLALANMLCGAGAASADESAWSGFYLGGDIGLNAANPVPASTTFQPFFGKAGDGSSPATRRGVARSDVSPSLELIFGGSTVVVDRVLFGFEFQGGIQNAFAKFGSSRDFGFTEQSGMLVFVRNEYFAVDSNSVKLAFDATAALRARVGFLATPKLLFFASVGPELAYIRLRTSHTDVGSLTIDSGFFPGLNVTPYSSTLSAINTTIEPGLSWTAGLEYLVAPHLTVRGEYAAAQFRPLRSSLSTIASSTSASFSITPFEQTAKVGVAYHF